ncbi:MAG: macro domain-containing protein [Alistipes senegalensis]|nr:macro domain-containing protein [Oxalobacter formigenes]MCM1281927.1 macro domain-containing protein [Alistipes senegalensis]
MRIECVLGDITKQPDAEAVVNSANANLRLGDGVAGAIHKAAGKELEEFCRSFVPLAIGKGIITPGFRLPNPWIIHVRAAHYLFDDNPEEKLEAAINSMMQIAEKQGIRSLAVPAIGIGVFAFPEELAAEIMVRTIKKYEKEASPIEWIRICVIQMKLLEIYNRLLV